MPQDKDVNEAVAVQVMVESMKRYIEQNIELVMPVEASFGSQADVAQQVEAQD